MPPRAGRRVTVTQRLQNLVEHSKVLTIAAVYALKLFSWDSHLQYTHAYTFYGHPVELLFALSKHLAWPTKNIVVVNFTSSPLRFLFSTSIWYKLQWRSSRTRMHKKNVNTWQLNCRVSRISRVLYTIPRNTKKLCFMIYFRHFSSRSLILITI